jgi:hypothetical protein
MQEKVQPSSYPAAETRTLILSRLFRFEVL